MSNRCDGMGIDSTRPHEKSATSREDPCWSLMLADIVSQRLAGRRSGGLEKCFECYRHVDGTDCVVFMEGEKHKWSFLTSPVPQWLSGGKERFWANWCICFGAANSLNMLHLFLQLGNDV